MFGDDDPEDAWDEGDDNETQVLVLARMLPSVATEMGDPGHDHHRVLVRLAFATGALERLRARREARLRFAVAVLIEAFQRLETEEGP